MGNLSNTTINGVSYEFKDAGAARQSHSHTKSQITDFPTSMPASDVPAWAKASSKPSYTASEVGAAAESDVSVTYVSPDDFFLPYSTGTLVSETPLFKQGKHIFGCIKVKVMSAMPLVGTIKTPYRPAMDVLGMLYLQNANDVPQPVPCTMSADGAITSSKQLISGAFVYFYVDYIIA